MIRNTVHCDLNGVFIWGGGLIRSFDWRESGRNEMSCFLWRWLSSWTKSAHAIKCSVLNFEHMLRWIERVKLTRTMWNPLSSQHCHRLLGTLTCILMSLIIFEMETEHESILDIQLHSRHPHSWDDSCWNTTHPEAMLPWDRMSNAHV